MNWHIIDAIVARCRKAEYVLPRFTDVSIGGSCLQSFQCAASDVNATCTAGICSCPTNKVPATNLTVCLPRKVIPTVKRDMLSYVCYTYDKMYVRMLKRWRSPIFVGTTIRGSCTLTIQCTNNDANATCILGICICPTNKVPATNMTSCLPRKSH